MLFSKHLFFIVESFLICDRESLGFSLFRNWQKDFLEKNKETAQASIRQAKTVFYLTLHQEKSINLLRMLKIMS